jgi:hypothetical protein
MMRCPQCEVGQGEVNPELRVLGRHARPGIGRLSLLYCEQCGTPIAPPDATCSLLDKLAQLARFGLSAGNAPLLSSEENGSTQWSPVPENN